MKTHALFLTVCFPISAAFPQITAQQVRDIRQTQIKTELEPQINVAKFEKREQNLPHLDTEQV